MKSNINHVWQDDKTNDAVIQRYLHELNPRHRFALQLSRRVKLTAWSMTVRGTLIAKRIMDIVVSTIALCTLSPIILLTWLAIKIEDAGPALFIQTRVGLNGRLFSMYKFRSMVIDAEKIRAQLEQKNESAGGVLFKMKNDPRVTNVGRVIRKLSIDEFPQLFNVLLGNMAMVGPRPALLSEVAQYSQQQRVRLHVKPGITSLWAIGGRSNIDFQGQVQLDVQYIRSQSIWLDLWIIIKTVPAILFGKGAY